MVATMNLKKLLIGLLIAAIVTPAMASATTFSTGPKNEQVVEGHTVFALIEKVKEGWAVAGLVREVTPKVLWFNDQYLVGGEDRYPCGGYVLAVPEGDASPFNEGIDIFALNAAGPSFDYLESYIITDPNDFVWEIDLYRYQYDIETSPTLNLFGSVDSLVWVVPILNTNIVDDGSSSCQPIVDAPVAGYLDPGLNAKCYSGGQYFDDGNQRCGPNTASCTGISQAYPDTQDFDGDGVSSPPGGPPVNTVPNGLTPTCDWPRLYNFLLFGYWSDLNGSGGSKDVRDGDNKQYGCSDANKDGIVDCTPGSPDFGADNEDKNGCEEGPYAPDTIQYDCMDEDGNGSGDPHTAADPADDNEGNSHAYNPTLCDTDGDGTVGSAGDTPCWGELHTHETARLDLYFSSTFRPQEPAVKNYKIMDNVGSAAPFHDHNGAAGTPTCPPGWISPGGGGYPGAPTPYCP